MAKKDAVTKRHIALRIAKQYHMPQTEVLKIVQGTFDTIIEILAERGRLELRNFGVFLVKIRKPRQARNPRTGEPVMLPKRKVVTFRPGTMMYKKIV
jgi:nucleoid DNA-binding protein